MAGRKILSVIAQPIQKDDTKIEEWTNWDYYLSKSRGKFRGLQNCVVVHENQQKYNHKYKFAINKSILRIFLYIRKKNVDSWN